MDEEMCVDAVVDSDLEMSVRFQAQKQKQLWALQLYRDT